MGDRLRFGSVALDKGGNVALIVFTDTGRSRYVDLQDAQIVSCIQLLAQALGNRRSEMTP